MLYELPDPFRFGEMVQHTVELTDMAEWLKAMLAVPFVLHSEPTGVFETATNSVEQMAAGASRRYEEVMLDVERMIDDHSKYACSAPQLYYAW
jgi:hypothetical protein